jgi:predicted phage terminase large subunit-like protein
VRVPSIEEVERRLCDSQRRGSLYRFLCLAWPVVEETPLVEGWHLEEVCAHLEAVSRGELDRLVINIPPGHTKSMAVSVIWQAWDWGPNRHPERKYMAGSFDADLSRRDSMKSKGLIQSDWYQRRWGKKADTAQLKAEGYLTKDQKEPVYVVTASKDKQDTASIWHSSGGGFRFATSVGGKATGWHAHKQIIDDPTNPTVIKNGGKQAMAQLDSDWAWYSGTMSTRKADPNWFARVIIMQRLHAADIAGRCIAEGYTSLVLPLNFHEKRKCVTPWGGDRRTVEGEILQSNRTSPQSIAMLRKELGPIQAAAQLDQMPSPENGVIFQREWFNQRIRFLPPHLDYIQSWDFTFKKTADSDYVVGTQWAWGGGKFYLLDIVRQKVGFLGGLQMVKDFRQKWIRVNHKILIEDKANGTAIMEVLDFEIPGIIPYSPSDSKEARANSVSGYWEAGDVLIQEDCPLVDEAVSEHTMFPRGEYDDIMDSCNQGLLYMAGKMKKRGKLEAAMKNAGFM